LGVKIYQQEKAVVDLGGVWKKALKRGRHEGRHRPYPNTIHCRKCGKRILNHTWFYSKVSGSNRNPHNEYYCEECFEGLWHE